MFVDTDAVHEAGRMATRIGVRVIDALKAADCDVAALRSSGWSGRDATSHESAWRKVLDGGLDLVRALVDSAELLVVVAADYATQDDTSADCLSALNLD